MTSSSQSTAHGAYRAVLIVTSASTFLAMLAYAGLLGNAVTLSQALAASPAGTTWMLASMSTGLAGTLLAIGVLADQIGRKRVFLAGAIVFALANLGCALATDMVVFVIARLITGLGAAGMIATSLGLVASVSEHAWQRLSTATWWSTAMGAGIALGPLITGMLDLAAGPAAASTPTFLPREPLFDTWRGFYLLLALGGLAIWIGGQRILHARRYQARLYQERIYQARIVQNQADAFVDQTQRLDQLGLVLLLGFLLSLITGIVSVRTDIDDAKTWAAVAAVMLLALVLSQRLGKRRLIAPGLFAHRPFLAATTAGFGTGAGVIAVMSFSGTYFVTELGVSTLHAGALMAAWSATSAVAALVLAQHKTKISATMQLVVGLIGVAIGIALMTTAPAAVIGLWPGLALAGLASGLLNTGLARAAVATVPAAHTATGTAANNTARYLGASIGVSTASIIATHQTHHSLAAGWDRVLWVGATVSLACALLVIVLSIPTMQQPRHRG